MNFVFSFKDSMFQLLLFKEEKYYTYKEHDKGSGKYSNHES